MTQDTTHLIQRPCYQRGSQCQDTAGNLTTRRPPDHRKEPQTAVGMVMLVWTGLAKTILQVTVKGGRRQGRQKKRWEDITREWTGLEFAKSERAVENRGKWRKLVVTSSVVPQRPSRLRDRSWWWWWFWWWWWSPSRHKNKFHARVLKHCSDRISFEGFLSHLP